MKHLLSILLAFVFLVTSIERSAAAVPVVDFASIAQLIAQVENTLRMIQQLRRTYEEITSLRKWADLDHEALATQYFKQFYERYVSEFKSILAQIEGYQNMFDQITRLDEVYQPYHTDWEKPIEGSGPNGEILPMDREARVLQKQALWTRIQMKHAAKVGAVVRDTLVEGQKDLERLMRDNKESAGMLLAVQIGNQLTGVVGKNLQTLNVQMNEYIQAFTAEQLEKNQSRGRHLNRLDDAKAGLGEVTRATPLPANPVGAF
jgi:conjugal transfer/entry exclusion protein